MAQPHARAYWCRGLLLPQALPYYSPPIQVRTAVQYGTPLTQLDSNTLLTGALCVDGSGGKHGSSCLLRRCGWGWVFVGRDEVVKGGKFGPLCGDKQTVPRAEFTAATDAMMEYRLALAQCAAQGQSSATLVTDHLNVVRAAQTSAPDLVTDKSGNADLKEEFWQEASRTKLDITKVKAHSKPKHLLTSSASDYAHVGNFAADAVAGVGAGMHEVRGDDARRVGEALDKHKYVLDRIIAVYEAWQQQRGSVDGDAPQESKASKPPPDPDLGPQLRSTVHRVVGIGGRLVCSRCLSFTGTTVKSKREWFQAGCSHTWHPTHRVNLDVRAQVFCCAVCSAAWNRGLAGRPCKGPRRTRSAVVKGPGPSAKAGPAKAVGGRLVRRGACKVVRPKRARGNNSAASREPEAPTAKREAHGAESDSDLELVPEPSDGVAILPPSLRSLPASPFPSSWPSAPLPLLRACVLPPPPPPPCVPAASSLALPPPPPPPPPGGLAATPLHGSALREGGARSEMPLEESGGLQQRALAKPDGGRLAKSGRVLAKAGGVQQSLPGKAALVQRARQEQARPKGRGRGAGSAVAAPRPALPSPPSSLALPSSPLLPPPLPSASSPPLPPPPPPPSSPPAPADVVDVTALARRAALATLFDDPEGDVFFPVWP